MVLSTIFAIAAAPVIGGLWLWKGPRQLKPENQTAKVVTARSFPNIFKKEKIVARNGAELFLGWGSSKVEDVTLNTFKVEIIRKGKDSALTLKDKVKAEVNAEFFVRVDASSSERIIKALESVGSVDQTKVTEYFTSKFDAALRAAAANMDIESIHTQRDDFRKTVKESLDLTDDGFILIDVALRQFSQSPLSDFDPNNSFDAVGLKKITSIIEESRKVINDTKQGADTQISERNKQEEVLRLRIAQEQTEATLAQNEQVAKMTAEQARRVAEMQATNTKEAQLAQIKAQQETEAARIAKEQQVAIAEEQRQKAIQIAAAERERAAEQARVETTRTVELANRDKAIALNAKALEEAAAEKAANEKRAEAVAAAESVTTARLVAEAQRGKQVEIIEAETEAGKTAAAQRIAAETQVLVAEKQAEAAKVTAAGNAQALKIEAEAEANATKLRAEAAYQEAFQKLKAAADGKLKDAEAQRVLNEALNSMDASSKAHLVELARVKITPEVVKEMAAPLGNVDRFNITSMNGSPVGGSGLGSLGGGGNGGGSNNVVQQVYETLLRARVEAPVIEEFIRSVGGDPSIASSVPGFTGAATLPAVAAAAAAVAAPKAVPAPANNNEQPVVPAPAKAAPKP